MSELNEDAFRRMLEAKGLRLDDKAFAAALLGARRLKGEVERVARYLAEPADTER